MSYCAGRVKTAIFLFKLSQQKIQMMSLLLQRNARNSLPTQDLARCAISTYLSIQYVHTHSLLDGRSLQQMECKKSRQQKIYGPILPNIYKITTIYGRRSTLAVVAVYQYMVISDYNLVHSTYLFFQRSKSEKYDELATTF